MVTFIREIAFKWEHPGWGIIMSEHVVFYITQADVWCRKVTFLKIHDDEKVAVQETTWYVVLMHWANMSVWKTCTKCTRLYITFTTTRMNKKISPELKWWWFRRVNAPCCSSTRTVSETKLLINYSIASSPIYFLSSWQLKFFSGLGNTSHSICWKSAPLQTRTESTDSIPPRDFFPSGV